MLNWIWVYISLLKFLNYRNKSSGENSNSRIREEKHLATDLKNWTHKIVWKAHCAQKGWLITEQWEFPYNTVNTQQLLGKDTTAEAQLKVENQTPILKQKAENILIYVFFNCWTWQACSANNSKAAEEPSSKVSAVALIKHQNYTSVGEFLQDWKEYIRWDEMQILRIKKFSTNSSNLEGNSSWPAGGKRCLLKGFQSNVNDDCQNTSFNKVNVWRHLTC